MWCSTTLLFALVGLSHCGPLTKDDKTASTQPRVSYSKDTIVKLGEDVTLDCAVEGLDLSNVDTFRIDWSKIDEEDPVQSLPITSGKVLVYSPDNKYQLLHPEGTNQFSLKVNAVSKEDTGLYRCLVYFAEDQFVTPKIYLDVETAPYFSDSAVKQISVTEGDNISLECKPAGVPEPTTTWQKIQDAPVLYSGNFLDSSTLSIPSISPSDQGRYACHADNGVGVAKTEIVITVEYAPVVEILTPIVGVDINQEHSIECKVESYPQADEVDWYKGEDLLLGEVNLSIKEKVLPTEENSLSSDPILSTAQSSVVVSTLTFAKITAESLGEYSCRATNKVGTKKALTQIQVKTPPEIVRQSARKVYYVEEASVGRSELPISIDCEASGVPAPEYKWTRNQRPLIWQSNHRYSLDPSSGSLLIEDPELSDNGWYQCIAYNTLGVAKSDPVYFYNASKIEFDLTDIKPTITLTAEEGRPFEMKCPSVESDPRPQINWIVASPPVNGKQAMEFFSSNRTVVGPDGTAYFTHVTKEDDSDLSGKVYMCVGTNEARPNDLSIGTTVTLKVVDPKDGVNNVGFNSVNIEPFLVYGSEKEVSFNGSVDNKLWCIFGGEPEPFIVWSNEKGVIGNSDQYQLDNFNTTLILKNSNKTHEGKYSCLASNTVGPVSEHQMTVKVEMPPVFTEQMQRTTVEEGAKVRFFCGVEGDGVMTYNWFFNGREISVPKDVRRRAMGNELIINPSLTTDTGNYACNATNKYGYAYGQTTLVVIPGVLRQTTAADTNCPEVAELKLELSSVKNSLNTLQEYVKNTRGSQSDASVDLIQRIAAKLDLLTEEEKELIAAQDIFKREQSDVNIQTVTKKQEMVQKPLLLKGEQKKKPVMQDTEVEQQADQQQQTATTEEEQVEEHQSTDLNTKSDSPDEGEGDVPEPEEVENEPEPGVESAPALVEGSSTPVETSSTPVESSSDPEEGLTDLRVEGEEIEEEEETLDDEPSPEEVTSAPVKGSSADESTDSLLEGEQVEEEVEVHEDVPSPEEVSSTPVKGSSVKVSSGSIVEGEQFEKEEKEPSPEEESSTPVEGSSVEGSTATIVEGEEVEKEEKEPSPHRQRHAKL